MGLPGLEMEMEGEDLNNGELVDIYYIQWMSQHEKALTPGRDSDQKCITLRHTPLTPCITAGWSRNWPAQESCSCPNWPASCYALQEQLQQPRRGVNTLQQLSRSR